MPVPNFPDKHRHRSVIEPRAAIAHRRAMGQLDEHASAPESVVILYQRDLWAAVRRDYELTTVGKGFTLGQVMTIDTTDGRVAVTGGFGIGAPVASILLEDLIALGTRQVLSIGTAGGLQPEMLVGDVVVCDSSIRDEGVSHHYAPPEEFAAADPELTQRFSDRLDRDGVAIRRGAAWTIDAPYRETVAELAHYRERGVLCVEMEAAALFTIGAIRGVPIASAFCISDVLTEDGWETHFGTVQLLDALRRLVHIGIETLADL